MAGKRAYSIRVQKKGASERKRLAAGREWFAVDVLNGIRVPRAPRGHRKNKAEPAVRTRRPPGGRGISDAAGIFLTGGKPLPSGVISSSRPKPRKEPIPKRHPKRRHRNLEK